MMKRTIWVLNKYASGHEDGFETRTMAIAREWVKAGHRVVVICSNANHVTGNRDLSEPVESRVLTGVRVIRLRTRRYERTASAQRVLSWVDFERVVLAAPLSELPHPDVIVVSSLSLLSVVSGMALARRYTCPWVFEVRDIWPLTLVEEGGVSAWHPFTMLLSALERLAYSRAALIVGTMPNLVAHVRARVRRPVPVSCVPFGFDPTSAAAVLPPRTRTNDGPSLVVGYAGSIGVSNALDTLVECAIQLREDSRFRFVIAGDGDRRQVLMDRTRDCPNVAWLGRVPRHEVHAILSSCDLLYFAAHQSKVWEYGMSLNKLTDYLLSARPILGSYSGFPSILDEASCGRFVPAADAGALLRALHDFRELPESARAQMGRSGRDWLFANRAWARIAKGYLDLLDQLIGSRY
jgi:glycosyltransferase involved in cell wall biosynthesis